jgi:Flp pilus assembly pilin Flp
MRIASIFRAASEHLKWLGRFADDFGALLADESGASLVEYALIVALVGATSVTALSALGTHTKTLLSSAASYLS